MGLESRFDFVGINKKLIEAQVAVSNAIISNLMMLGEECLNEVRNNGSYMDDTGNLRSSTGYFVVKDGDIVDYGGFKKVRQGNDGVEAGKSLIDQIIDNYNSGYALIVVAGMEYAAAVESKGFNVLTSGEILAKTKIPVILRRVKNEIKRR